MKKWIGMVLTTILLVSSAAGFVYAENGNTINKLNTQLTDKQKAEISAMHKEAFEKEKKVIDKYVEYGVMSEETGKMIVSHMEMRLKKLEGDGFIPHMGKFPTGKDPHHGEMKVPQQ